MREVRHPCYRCSRCLPTRRATQWHETRRASESCISATTVLTHPSFSWNASSIHNQAVLYYSSNQASCTAVAQNVVFNHVESLADSCYASYQSNSVRISYVDRQSRCSSFKATNQGDQKLPVAAGLQAVCTSSRWRQFCRTPWSGRWPWHGSSTS